MKLGTRTYCIFEIRSLVLGDGAPPEKVIRHSRVCKMTTSGSLGIRLSGMRVVYFEFHLIFQVYRPYTNDWLSESKSWGKSLNRDTLLQAIALFLYNGKCFRTDVLDVMISKLTRLREIVREVGVLNLNLYCRATGDSGLLASF